jgi:hypothetical protein
MFRLPPARSFLRPVCRSTSLVWRSKMVEKFSNLPQETPRPIRQKPSRNATRPSDCSTNSRKNWRDKSPFARRWWRVWPAVPCAVGGNRQSLEPNLRTRAKNTKALSRIRSRRRASYLPLPEMRDESRRTGLFWLGGNDRRNPSTGVGGGPDFEAPLWTEMDCPDTDRKQTAHLNEGLQGHDCFRFRSAAAQ